MITKITRRQLRQLINEAIKGFHWAQKPSWMKDKIKADPNVDKRIKGIMDAPDQLKSSFELVRTLDPTGEYGEKLDQHDHAFLASPEYEKMQQADEKRTSDMYRLAKWKELVNYAIDQSGLRRHLDDLAVDITMHKKHDVTMAGIRSTNHDALLRLKDYLDMGGGNGHIKGTTFQTYPDNLFEFAESEDGDEGRFFAFYTYPI